MTESEKNCQKCSNQIDHQIETCECECHWSPAKRILMGWALLGHYFTHPEELEPKEETR